MTNAFAAGPNAYWRDLIKDCTEESYQIAQDAELFVHNEMIPQLFEQESTEDQHAFFSKLDWPMLRQTSPLLFKTLAPKAMSTEETLIGRGLNVQRNAQLAAIQNPPDALQVMQHLFGDEAVGMSPGGVLGGGDNGAAALQELDKTEGQQDKAVKYQFQPRPVMGLKLPSQRGASETAGQGLESLPMGRGG